LNVTWVLGHPGCRLTAISQILSERTKVLKLLNIVDEHTREALMITVDRRIGTDATVNVLDQLVAERGRPTALHPL
jgi:hypothetical protein